MEFYPGLKNYRQSIGALALLFALGACTTSGNTNSSGTSSTIPTTTIADGVKAAKIIFRTGSPTGSFDAPSSDGTVPTPGSGLQAKRIYNTDGSLLALGGPEDSAWPKWISSVEIGISGSKNTSAVNSNCARFAAVDEDTNSKCNFKQQSAPVADLTNCGAPSGAFRVSEYDCAQAAIAVGTGGPSDGVYIRTTFNRDTQYLGTAENVMAVLEYGSANLNGAPTDPTTCFSNGALDTTATGCSDQTWKIFLKPGASDTVQPFMMLVPPAFGWVRTSNGTSGFGTQTKQIILPLAGDSSLSVLQISRIRALADDLSTSGTFSKTCTAGSGEIPANSPLCLGMIFYSLTFYRM